jgi:hypothetical protein
MAGEVRFTPTAADYVGARRDSFRRWLRRRGLLLLAIPPVIALLGGMGEPPTATDLLYNLLGFGILGLMMSAAILGLWFLWLPWSSRRLYAQSKTIQLDHACGWSEAGYSYASEVGSGQIKWPMLHGWQRGRRAFLFYFNDSVMHFLPLRVLDPAEAADLQATLERSGLRRL